MPYFIVGKPFRIEAEQFLPDTAPLPFHDEQACKLGPNGWYVITMHEQETPIVCGDWIIREPVPGRFYPCKPEVFLAKYEEV